MQSAILKRIFSFEGRIGRAAFWGVQGPLILVAIVYRGLVESVPKLLGSSASHVAVITLLVAMVVTTFPIIWIQYATLAKRFHDRGKSGYWSLLIVIPIIGFAWIMIECGLLRGTSGSNRYGLDPLQLDRVERASAERQKSSSNDMANFVAWSVFFLSSLVFINRLISSSDGYLQADEGGMFLLSLIIMVGTAGFALFGPRGRWKTDRTQRFLLASTAAWILAVVVYYIWDQVFFGGGFDVLHPLAAIVLPLLMGWSCFALYHWARHQPR